MAKEPSPLERGLNGVSEKDFENSVRVVEGQEGWSSDYYQLPPNASELGDLIEYRDMNFNVGNIFKACYRLGHKEGVSDIYDLHKIKYFVEREIHRRNNV